MIRVTAFACVVAVLASAHVAALADEEKVPLDKLPKAVSEAVKKKFPKAKVVSAAKEPTEDKKGTVYEVQLKDGESNVDLTVTPEGSIVSIEKEITVKDLPKEVKAALDDKYDKATIKKVEELTSGKDLKDLAYEVLLVARDKKTYEVKFDPKGKVLNVEEKKEEEKKEKEETVSLGDDKQQGNARDDDEKKDKKKKKKKKKEKKDDDEDDNVEQQGEHEGNNGEQK